MVYGDIYMDVVLCTRLYSHLDMSEHYYIIYAQVSADVLADM